MISNAESLHSVLLHLFGAGYLMGNAAVNLTATLVLLSVKVWMKGKARRSFRLHSIRRNIL